MTFFELFVVGLLDLWILRKDITVEILSKQIRLR